MKEFTYEKKGLCRMINQKFLTEEICIIIEAKDLPCGNFGECGGGYNLDLFSSLIFFMNSIRHGISMPEFSYLNMEDLV